MACWVDRKFASLQAPLATSARALRDPGALSPLRPPHNAIELLLYEPLSAPWPPCTGATLRPDRGTILALVGRDRRVVSPNRPFQRRDLLTRVLRASAGCSHAANSSAQVRRRWQQPVFARCFAAI